MDDADPDDWDDDGYPTGPDWPAYEDMVALRLNEGPASGTVLQISPTMHELVYHGMRYFRMDGRSVLADGSMGGQFLWDGWAQGWHEQIRRKRMREVLQELVDAVEGNAEEWVDNEGVKRTDLDDYCSRTYDALQAAKAELAKPELPSYRELLEEAYKHLRGLGQDQDLAPLLARVDEALRDR